MLSRKTARDEEPGSQHAKVRHSHWQTWARSENPRACQSCGLGKIRQRGPDVQPSLDLAGQI